MRNAARVPVVLFAAVVDRFRRLPGARRRARFVPWLAPALFFGAFVAVLVWGSTRSPQRISLADLSNGKLSAMQSWIIVTGVLREDSSLVPGQLLYRLTDPATPDASLLVYTDNPLRVGPTTISGSLQGGRADSYALRPWVGTLIADPTLASEIPPPWLALALGLAGVLVVLARRTTYPVFFGSRTGLPPRPEGRLPVEIRRAVDGTFAPPSIAVVEVGQDGGPRVTLFEPGRDPSDLRIHSQFTNAKAGELRSLRWRRPAIKLRRPMDDIVLTFTTSGDRDTVFATVRDDARARMTVPG